MTTVLPTFRAIRQQVVAQKAYNGFLQRYMTMGELMSRAVIVDGYEAMDSDTRTLLLLEASDFKAFSQLQIERNFFSFTRNAAYLFRFFEELSGELVSIEQLDCADTYGDYSEHISILTLLRERYKNLCEERKLLDRIFLPERYRLNHAWLSTLEGLEISAEGYLTHFELNLLYEIAETVPVILLFEGTQYNLKMQHRLDALGIETRSGYRYRIALQTNEILSETPASFQAQLCATPLSERVLQSAFIKQKMYEMTLEGITPERIAVVLPDEGFVPLLRVFDAEGNFNFAMGESLAASLFARRCEALMAYDEHPGVENGLRVQRLFKSEAHDVLPRFSEVCDAKQFTSTIEILLEGEAERIASIVREERFYFERLITRLKAPTLGSLLHLFVNRIRTRSVDDVRGGKVTVMGVLETRACVFEGVIIVDFNENYVPHKSDKDLYINSHVRGRAGLPTTAERETLQKQFYYMLMSRAKRVEIAYVQNESALPSRFLKELGIESERRYEDDAWADILFKRGAHRQRRLGEIEAAYDFTARPLSATGLRTFLECRRKFYHRYVETLTPHTLPREMPEEYEMGNTLHAALSDVYREQDHFSDAKTLQAAIAKAMARHGGHTPFELFLQRLWLKKLAPFYAREIARFESVRVRACETTLQTAYAGLMLEGRIDRIDIGPEGLEVLDYKSGKYALYTARSVEAATDFQPEFYALLAAVRGEVAYSGFYDLQRGEIVKDPTHLRKMELLQTHLQALAETKTYVFEQTEVLSRCRFCAYACLCRRESV